MQPAPEQWSRATRPLPLFQHPACRSIKSLQDGASKYRPRTPHRTLQQVQLQRCIHITMSMYERLAYDKHIYNEMLYECVISISIS